ncbi:glutamate ABC transporter substrate-binding protein [Galactobacter sp.]|uniref:glutamate ABC transporter substrate-binding protein n=1 Tax=Galactobacter sp. TaxID=2676125 RepID=UPI0025C21FFB|nr:glutamate ABC transporter substrate-binding protein [Galactobacter sp.]
MKLFTKRRGLAAASMAAVAALALTACGGDSDSGSGGGGDTGLKYDVATDVSIDGSDTFDKIKKDGKITIGVKEDQPSLGYLDAATKERSGFDIEIARWMAASLGVKESDIKYKLVDSAQREQALQNGTVDLYVGTYSITDERKEMVGFAGPYFVTGQSLLVKKDSKAKSIEDLGGKKICSITGSTPLQNLKKKYTDIETVEMDKYSVCVDALKNDKVDAVTTDEAILLGYAAEDPDNLKTIGEQFTEERYGIGLPKGDTALCEALTTTLKDGGDTWTEIFDATLGKSGAKVEQPEPDACS